MYMDNEKIYLSKLMTPQQVLDLVQSGDKIMVGPTSNTPQNFLQKLHTVAPRLKEPVELYEAGLSRPHMPFFTDPACRGKIKVNCNFFHPQDRGGDPRIVSYHPANLHAYFSRAPFLDPDLLVTAGTTMDKHGYICLPCGLSMELEAAMHAKKVVIEVNPNMPRPHGMNQLHISEVYGVCEVDYPPLTLESDTPTETDMEIGRIVASLINDGDTIQLGIGAMPNAVGIALRGKKDLGVHTEMLSSIIVDLVKCGAVTGRKKTLWPGKIVYTFSYGDQALYDFVNNNPCAIMLPGNYVNDPFVISRNDNMVSINTCVQVDLTGQVCSESIGTRQFSGTGGQTDTATGAIRSRGGRSIIAVHSTKKNGTVSTIAPTLLPGAVVTLSRNNLDYLVTEFGVADLKGKSVRDRACALISVAHPDFRGELMQQAIELGYAFPEDFNG